VDASLTCSWEYRAAADSARAEGWFGNLDVGGGDESPGVGGDGVRTTARVFGSWDDGGGVMEEVVGGAGDVNFSILAMGDPEREADRSAGVAGIDSSVDGISTDSWEACDNGASSSILPRRKRDQDATDTSGLQTGRALFAGSTIRKANRVRRLPVVCATREGMVMSVEGRAGGRVPWR